MRKLQGLNQGQLFPFMCRGRCPMSRYPPPGVGHLQGQLQQIHLIDTLSLSSTDYPNVRKIIGQNSDKRTEYPTIRNPGFAHKETSERFIQSLELFSVTQQTSEHQTFPNTCIPSILNFETFRKSAYYFGLKVCKEFQNEIPGRLWSRVSK